jgi:epoxyqueuosine reductase
MWPSASILREMALEAGFELVGIGPVQQADHSERFLRWIELGRHGEMDYLAQNRERIAAPERWRPGLRSGLSVALDYTRGEIRVSDPSGAGGGSAGARVARYAAGRDYHRVIGKRLERLKKRLVADGAPTEGLHYGVDALPFLERALGIGAGVGFLAKSSMLLSPARGPMLLLGELLLGREYPPDAAAHGSCGTCTACLDACPTDAFAGPFELDARRCLSYSSIELRGPVPRELREAQSEWLFGCDICLEVCPFVRHGACESSRPRPRRAPGAREIRARRHPRAQPGAVGPGLVRHRHPKGNSQRTAPQRRAGSRAQREPFGRDGAAARPPRPRCWGTLECRLGSGSARNRTGCARGSPRRRRKPGATCRPRAEPGGVWPVESGSGPALTLRRHNTVAKRGFAEPSLDGSGRSSAWSGLSRGQSCFFFATRHYRAPRVATRPGRNRHHRSWRS